MLQKGGHQGKPASVEQGLSNLSLNEKAANKEVPICLKPPPPPPAPLSPVGCPQRSPTSNAGVHSKLEFPSESEESSSTTEKSAEDFTEDDFGDFQAAV